MKYVPDECWFCGKALRPGAYVVQVQLARVSADGIHSRTLKHGLYDLACLNCACKARIPGINLGNLAACAPKGWTRQVSTLNLQRLYHNEYPDETEDFPRNRRAIVAHIRQYV